MVLNHQSKLLIVDLANNGPGKPGSVYTHSPGAAGDCFFSSATVMNRDFEKR